MSNITPIRQSSVLHAHNDDHLIDLWLRNKRSENTQKAYRRDVKEFLQFVDTDVGSVVLEDMISYREHLEEKNLKPASVRRKLNVVKSLMSFAVKIGYIRFNVGAVVEGPQQTDTKVKKILTRAEVFAIFDQAEDHPRDHIILRLLYSGGLRVNALCNIKRDDIIDREDGRIQINIERDKGDSTHQLLLSKKMSRSLREYMEEVDTTYLFPSENDTALHTNTIRKLVKKYSELADIGKDVSPHWFRHSHISHALDNGAPLHVLKPTVDHKNIQTTSGYAHARPDATSSDYVD